MQFLRTSTRSHRLPILSCTIADYDLYVQHNNEWISFSKKQAAGGTLDIDSGVQHCFKEPHVENIFFRDPNEAKGQYAFQVDCASQSACTEECLVQV